jgi:hypothetical protein
LDNAEHAFKVSDSCSAQATSPLSAYLRSLSRPEPSR